jgi:hypothetical protein
MALSHGPLTRTLLLSGPWDTVSVGGEEVDIDWLLEGPRAGQPAAPSRSPCRPNGDGQRRKVKIFHHGERAVASPEPFRHLSWQLRYAYRGHCVGFASGRRLARPCWPVESPRRGRWL